MAWTLHSLEEIEEDAVKPDRFSGPRSKKLLKLCEQIRSLLKAELEATAASTRGNPEVSENWCVYDDEYS